MTTLKLKDYQEAALTALRDYFTRVTRLSDPGLAFYELTGSPYLAASAAPKVPYVCLRVPTGGGKTIMAAHSVALAADAFMETDTPAVLWLVPSQAIRDQTLATLQNREHPNRVALAERFGENVRILTVPDALRTRRADYDGGAVVIVATIQSFRIDETEGRRVYEPNGELMDHFMDPGETDIRALEQGPDSLPVFSLANVLRSRRPLVIIDEAHNVRTELSFETLSRLSPSAIVEFTATPVRPEVHDPAKGIFASNILHEVSAAELKAAQMIKLPVILRGRPDPRDTIADAIAWLDHLAGEAVSEEELTGEFLRPMMLLQAEPRSKEKPTLHAEALRTLLIEDFLVPPDHIALATGDVRELERLDLSRRDCRIRFVVTQQALREGWDCPFAYVLCSVAEQRSSRSVEQLLGRVLRLPGARSKFRTDLNRAYAFATTTSFQNAVLSIQDGLVAQGFARTEARTLVRAAEFPSFEDRSADVVRHDVPDGMDAVQLESAIIASGNRRIEVDTTSRTITVRGPLSDYDRAALVLAMPLSQGLVEVLVARSRGAQLSMVAEDALPQLSIPRLAVRRGERLELFDRGHFLDEPWRLEECDPGAALSAFAPPSVDDDEARLDVSGTGQMTLEFSSVASRQTSLPLADIGWTKAALINWVDRRLPISSRRDVTRTSSTLFIAAVIDLLRDRMGFSLEMAARARFRLVEAVIRAIATHRTAHQLTSFGRALLPVSGLEFATSSELALVLDESRYAYSTPYKGGTKFKKHLFSIIGDLETAGEEYEFALHLDRSPAVRNWIRNTVRQPYSFWLQTASDRFYPDFIALLENDVIAVVEYKGVHLVSADDAREKRLIGELWAERSAGGCVFAMITDRRFDVFDSLAAGAGAVSASQSA